MVKIILVVLSLLIVTIFFKVNKAGGDNVKLLMLATVAYVVTLAILIAYQILNIILVIDDIQVLYMAAICLLLLACIIKASRYESEAYKTLMMEHCKRLDESRF